MLGTRQKATRGAVGLVALVALWPAACSNGGATPTTTTAVTTTTAAATTTAVTTSEATTTTAAVDTVRVAPDGSGDAPDLASALAAIAPGGAILLEAGEHILGGPLLIEAPVTLRGMGSGQTTVIGESRPELLRFTGPGHLTLEGITFRYEGTEGADGLVVEGGTISFTDVVVAGAVLGDELGGSAFLLIGNTTGTVHRCTADENQGHGFFFGDTTDIRVTDSTASANGGSGFAWLGQATGTTTASTAERNRQNGFEIAGAATPDLAGNEAATNLEAGFRWSDTAAGKAEANVARSNGFSGFVALNRARPNLTDNESEENGDDGFLFKGTSRATVARNRAVGNTWAGFRWVDQASGTAEANTAAGNADGFWVADEADPTLIGNTSHGHHTAAGNGSGLVFSGTAGGAARRNDIFDNDWGIALGMDAAPSLADNDVHDNTSNQVTGVAFG